MKKRTVRKMTLSRESIRRLTGNDLGDAQGAGRTANPTCFGFSCLETCGTCPPTCATCLGTVCVP